MTPRGAGTAAGRIRARGVADLALGVCLVAQPFVLGVPTINKVWANAFLAGIFLVEATLLGTVLGECRPVRWAKTALGGWLVVSPLVLGFGALAPSLGACLVGALVLASTDTARNALDLAAPIRSSRRRSRARALTPERITGPDGPQQAPTPERLAAQIGDGADGIRRTLLGGASEAELRMCALGYQALTEEAASLTRLLHPGSKELGHLRRLWLGVLLHRTEDSLSRARECFPRKAVLPAHPRR